MNLDMGLDPLEMISPYLSNESKNSIIGFCM
jgi:hypothetical protein